MISVAQNVGLENFVQLAVVELYKPAKMVQCRAHILIFHLIPDHISSSINLVLIPLVV